MNAYARTKINFSENLRKIDPLEGLDPDNDLKCGKYCEGYSSIDLTQQAVSTAEAPGQSNFLQERLRETNPMAGLPDAVMEQKCEKYCEQYESIELTI